MQKLVIFYAEKHWIGIYYPPGAFTLYVTLLCYLIRKVEQKK